MTLAELCYELQLPDEVKERILCYEKEIHFVKLKNMTDKLAFRDSWDKAVEELKEVLSEDTDGMKMLTVMLNCCLHTYEQYEEKGISREIFRDTMRFCTRFIEEHKRLHGNYAFTWGWWFPRQLSMNEFRIGSLEYELVEQEEKKISIHIPADASLEANCIEDSLKKFQRFLSMYYPKWQDVDLYCESWLLSPALTKLLDKQSRIMQFQNRFEILNVEEESMAILDWVYPGKYDSYEELPEKTSLQKNLKQFLLNGGKPGWTTGKLIKNEKKE